MLVAIALSGVLPATATPRRGELEPLFACLPVAGDAARLACLDHETRMLERRSRDTSDRASSGTTHEAEIATRPSARTRSKPLAFQPIDDVLVEATLFAGRWLFATKNSGIWQQAENGELGRTPRVGDRLRVRRGALGSFLANIGDGPAVRVRPSR